MDAYNIYLIGVGGQGIGLLSEIMLRAADHAGLKVKGVDTHGLAQRGGIVKSQLRFGDAVHSPLIPAGQADLVVAMERNETLRATNGFLKDGGTLVYYDTVWQPLEVRLNRTHDVDTETIEKECIRRNITRFRVFSPELADARMQNIVLLARICKNRMIPSVAPDHFRSAMADLMAGGMLERNMALFEQELNKTTP